MRGVWRERARLATIMDRENMYQIVLQTQSWAPLLPESLLIWLDQSCLLQLQLFAYVGDLAS